MHRSPIPSLRDDPGKTRPGAMLVIDPRQQNAKFGRNTGSELLLQTPLAQHAFEEGAVSNQACAGDIRSQSVRNFTLKHPFPPRFESVIDPQIRSKKRTFGCFAKVFKRTKLNFQFTRFRHSCIGTVERAIGLCSAAQHARRSAGGSAATLLTLIGRNGTPKSLPAHSIPPAPRRRAGRVRTQRARSEPPMRSASVRSGDSQVRLNSSTSITPSPQLT